MSVPRSTPVSFASSWAQIFRTCSATPGARIDPISRWLIATRACVQPMTLTAAAIAGLLAVGSDSFSLPLFSLASLGLVVAHAANNMINDYFDLRAGVDTGSYPRALYAPHPVLSGLIDERHLVRAIFTANIVDAVVMLVLAYYRGWPVVAFAVAGLFISVFYVAPPLRLKDRGLGEPAVAIVWGPLMVAGTYYSATGSLAAEVWWASIPYALLVTTVLMGKHLDKLPWDLELGAASLPVRLGESASRRLTVVLMVAFYVAVVSLVIAGSLTTWSLFVLGAIPLLVKAVRRFARPKPELPPENNSMWPIWFAAWAFLHTRRAGALLVLGLAIEALV